MATVRINLPNTGIRQTNTGKWAAIVFGQWRGDYVERVDAIKAAGSDRVLA